MSFEFHPESQISRRTILSSAAAVSGLSCISSSVWAKAVSQNSDESRQNFEIWDSHTHLAPVEGRTPEHKVDRLLRFADRMHVARLITFMGWPFVQVPTPDQIVQQNDQVLQALKHAPDRLLGYVYLNPEDVTGSLREMNRCLVDGPMVGVKLWVARRCNVDSFDPIIELATDLGVPIYQHTWIKSTGNLKGESTPADLVKLAERHPSAKLICGHSGGTWELGLRSVRRHPSLRFEIAGAEPAAGITERAVEELGAERVIFGSDSGGRSLATQLAKIVGAEITSHQKRLILGDNIRKLLRPVLAKKGFAQ